MARGSGGRRRWLTVLRAAFVVVLVACLVLVLVDRGEELRRSAERLSAGVLLTALLPLLAGLWLNMLAWRRLLVDLGSTVPVLSAARVYFVGQLGKYVPGSVWPVLVQMEMGRAWDVPRARMAVAGLLAMALGVVSGGLLVAAALPVVLATTELPRPAVLYALPLLLVLLHPRVLTALLALALRTLRQPPLERPLSARGVAVTTALLLGTWVLFGASTWVLADALGAERSPTTVVVAVAGFAFASVAGLLMVLAPAGAGVREGALVLALSAVLPTSPATVVALASRALFTVGDVVLAAATAVPRRARVAAPRADDAPVSAGDAPREGGTGRA